MRAGVAAAILGGSHIVGGAVGGAIGGTMGLQDHGVALGAGFFVGAATTILNYVPPLRANERVYVVDALDIAPTDVTDIPHHFQE